jgi:hypothetical protein
VQLPKHPVETGIIETHFRELIEGMEGENSAGFILSSRHKEDKELSRTIILFEILQMVSCWAEARHPITMSFEALFFLDSKNLIRESILCSVTCFTEQVFIIIKSARKKESTLLNLF